MRLMPVLPDFEIKPVGEISKAFLDSGIHSYHKAIQFVRELPYGRNPDKDNLKTVLIDCKGTCSTKHALLKTLADENGVRNLELKLGIFRMNAQNTPPVAATLEANKLPYIPEAHMYLKYENQIFDFTRRHSMPEDFEEDLISEQNLLPDQINQYKVDLHKKFLAGWIAEKNIPFKLDEVWAIREQCIQDLSKNSKQS